LGRHVQITAGPRVQAKGCDPLRLLSLEEKRASLRGRVAQRVGHTDQHEDHSRAAATAELCRFGLDLHQLFLIQPDQHDDHQEED